MLFVTSHVKEGGNISMIEKNSGTQFDRSTFLKDAAATGAMGAIAAAHPFNSTQSANDDKSANPWRDEPYFIDERLISDGGTCDLANVG